MGKRPINREKYIQRLKQLLWAEHSWKSARDLCELALSLPELKSWNHLEHAMATGVVVSYARPFGKNDGIGSLKKDFRTFDDKLMKQNHDLLLKARDTIFGHKDHAWELDQLEIEPTYTIKIAEDSTFKTFSQGLVVNHFDGILQLLKYQLERMKKSKERHIQLIADTGIPAGDYTLGEDFPPY